MKFAADPGKRWTEKFVLVYTPVWIAAVLVVMATRAFTHWGDLGHMALGVGMCLPLWIVPLFFGPDRERPFAERHIWRFNLWIGLYSFLQCYFGSALFFDVLHMEYHFPVTWIVNRTPLFLYFMTVAYFSTYYVVMSVLWRTLAPKKSTIGEPSGARRGAAASQWRAACPIEIVRFILLCILGYAVAFAETAGMANDWLREVFSYRDKWFVLLWGSACYGTVFVLSLPFVFRMDESPDDKPRRVTTLAGEVLAVNMAALIAYEGWALILR